MRPRLLAAACLALALGCAIGPGRRFEASRTPQGARVAATVAGSGTGVVKTEVRGELLEVHANGLLVLGKPAEITREGAKAVEMRRVAERPALLLLPFDRILEARFTGLGRWSNIDAGRAPTAEVRERLRLVGRFPQGLAPDQLRRLLAAQGQLEVRRLGP
jgi:hypothetical protein